MKKVIKVFARLNFLRIKRTL